MQISSALRWCLNSFLEHTVLCTTQPTCGEVIVKQKWKGFMWRLMMRLMIHSFSLRSQDGRVKVSLMTRNVPIFFYDLCVDILTQKNVIIMVLTAYTKWHEVLLVFGTKSLSRHELFFYLCVVLVCYLLFLLTWPDVSEIKPFGDRLVVGWWYAVCVNG